MSAEVLAACIGGAIGFASGLSIVLITGLQSHRASRAARAFALYDQYVDRCRVNPAFSASNAFLSQHPGDWTFDPFTFESLEVERYHWTVTQMLYALEEVLRLQKNDAEWRLIAINQIAYHTPYFQRSWASLKPTYTSTINEMVAEVLEKKEAR